MDVKAPFLCVKQTYSGQLNCVLSTRDLKRHDFSLDILAIVSLIFPKKKVKKLKERERGQKKSGKFFTFLDLMARLTHISISRFWINES